MILIVSKYLLPKGYSGLALFPFIILENKNLKNDAVFINHERIHLRQQIELLILPFYIWYLLEFLFRFLQEKNIRKAYRNISFEREAYNNEKDLGYLKKRSLYSFLSYF